MAPDITVDELDKEVLEELRSLPGDLAILVGRHLVAAERALQDDDPEQAYEHTKVARRFAARIGVVREAAGIVAYHAGHYSEALSDLRAARRMTGSDAYLPIMADCERGLGRPERAIDLVRSPEAERLDRAGRIELTIVESGARRDLGQHDAAVITLQRLPELRDPQAKPWSARLAFAYADSLADAGHQDAAVDWFGKAMAFDEDGETDAAERYAELTGALIEDVEEEFDLEDDAVENADGDEGTAQAGRAAEAEADEADEADVDEAEAGEDAEGEDAALAEADDLGDAESADVSDEAAEEGDLGDDERDETVAPSAAEEDAGPAEVDDDSSDDRSEGGEVAEISERSEGSEAARADEGVEDAESAPEAEAAEGSESEDDAGRGAVKEPSGQAAEVPGITPAFIEPDFGDVLDESGKPVKGKATTDD
ncbi:hypothetical protein [Nonomuraea antimicrobica]